MELEAKLGPPQQELMQTIKTWCEGSIPNIMDMMDWHVKRADGGVLGFRADPAGQAKILAVAHLDYKGTGEVHQVSPYHIMSSALDDRLGACLAYNLELFTGIPADVVFTDKEETGQSTLPMLGTKMLNKYNWIVEFDRRLEGAVCYDYACMEAPVAKHFDVHMGSFSDISAICHESPIGAFNMAVGYNLEHTEKCIALSGMILRQMERFKAFYEEYGDVKILHTPPTATRWQRRQNYGIGSTYQHHHHPSMGRSSLWDDDDYTNDWTGYGSTRHWEVDSMGRVVTPTPAKIIQLPGTAIPDEPDAPDETDYDDLVEAGYEYDPDTGLYFKKKGML